MNMDKVLTRLFLLSIIGFSIFGIWKNNKNDERRQKAYEQEQIDYFGESTMNFFKEFDCSSLKYSIRNISFEKIFLLDDCAVSTNRPMTSYRNSILKPYISNNIDEVDYIILFSRENGGIEGEYQYGTKAVRNYFIVKIIDKITLEIINEQKFRGVGEPKKVIERYRGDGERPETFGSPPIAEIVDYIIGYKR